MKEINITQVLDQMENLYEANVGMMLLSLPGAGKTEMITFDAKKLLAKHLGSAEAAEKAFFIVDMSGIPSESLAVPFINPEANPAQLKLQYIQVLANPDVPQELKDITKEELDKLLAQDESEIRRLHRDVISEIRDAKQWVKENPGEKCIVFIDEITSANQDDQRTLMNFIQSGISPDGSKMDLRNIWFVIAGNPSSEMPGYEDYDGATNNIEEAVVTRVATFFVKADVNDVLAWGKQVSSDGNSNIHPYLISALEHDRSMYMKKDPSDIRLMNSRTLFKLSEYFKASTRIGKKWQAHTVNALVGEHVGVTLCAIIQKLDQLVSIEELFGKKTDKTLNAAALARFKELQEFEKYYIVSSALDEESPLEINEAAVRKLMILINDGGIPAETISSLAKRILDAPAGTKLRALTHKKYILDKELSIIQKCNEIRNFAAGSAFS